MHPSVQDLRGQQFGHLTVIARVASLPADRRRARWWCRCTCGTEKAILAQHLRKPKHPTVSCGCYNLVRVRTPRPLPITLNTDSTASIPLSQGKVAVIDEGDEAKCAPYRWTARKAARKLGPPTFYAYARIQTRHVALHRFLLDAPRGLEVDHRDGDGLNNRRANLRIATSGQNKINTAHEPGKHSRFRGVNRASTHRWNARIRVRQKRYYLGSFVTEEMAAMAYDQAARQFHGEFAHLNFG